MPWTGMYSFSIRFNSFGKLSGEFFLIRYPIKPKYRMIKISHGPRHNFGLRKANELVTYCEINIVNHSTISTHQTTVIRRMGTSNISWTIDLLTHKTSTGLMKANALVTVALFLIDVFYYETLSTHHTNVIRNLTSRGKCIRTYLQILLISYKFFKNF